MKKNKKNTLIVISGVPGSGKSTLAKKMYDADRMNSIIINNDRIRQMLTGTDDATVNDTYRYEDASQRGPMMWLLKKAMIEAVLGEYGNKNIILDAVHFNKNQIDYFYSLTEKYDVEIINIFLDVDKETALQRAQNRVRKEDAETIDFCSRKLDELNLDYDFVLSNDGEIEEFLKKINNKTL